MRNIMSVDVEDYFHVANFANKISLHDWDSYPLRVEQNTQRILQIFAQHNVQATFYVLAWVAERCPQLVREICQQGHELACHGYAHQLIYEQGPQAFREDIKKAKCILEDISGEQVIGYRAPSYSITNKSLWAIDILYEEGFRYDSSIFPTHHDRYGIPQAKRHRHLVKYNTHALQEFPPSTVPIGKWNFPIAGGGYFRLFPYSITKKSIEFNNREQQPFVFYLHPWEIDPQQPRIKGISATKRFRHYVNLHSTEKKLRRLVQDFSFTYTKEYLESVCEKI
ncbi:XrtA system polysaccharide deacetylase [Candidatus Uabimicrobium amorphum]|uniref:Polysaccharide deacetylase n=1 Tax=Uabimicrobium amorphum TaxID=2596890 RepID=A0A5S9F3J9_UABAM|nr:XrtA system polysaccharide deacetylase [Candidatus Uabimicrobium amorphum]BBM84817.1 polysaccharide deacetylase [Candidatus Uabimicrobium amorphum]